MDKIAIVILNWNGCELLRSFLPSVIRHSMATGATIYVADNASSDSSVAMLATEFPGVKRLILDRNYGFAEGYNRALRLIEATYAVLLNSDVEVTDHWLEPLISYMDTHPETSACQPKIKSWKQRDLFEYAGAAGGFIDRFGYPYCRGRIMGAVETDHGQYDDSCPVFWTSGAAMLIRLKDYWEVGGLDGRFFAHMEEIDLCWRLRARGHQLACISQSTVYHVGGATLKKENPRKTFLNFRNNLLMLYKNLPTHEFAAVMRTRQLLDYLAALNFLLKFQVANARAVLQARRAYRKLRPFFAEDRANNLRQTVQTDIPERSQNCILWDFYVKGRKHFQDKCNSAL